MKAYINEMISLQESAPRISWPVSMIFSSFDTIGRLSSKLKVTDFVVTSIVVNMMNYLVRLKFSIEMLLHYISVFVLVHKIHIHIPILNTFASLIACKLRASYALTPARLRAVYSLIIIKVAPFYSKVARAHRALHNIVKSSLLARNFLDNNMFIHTVMITQRSL